MAIGAIAALKAAGKHPGKNVIVASIDGEKDALNAIINGEEGTTVQSSPFFGPVSFQTIDQYAGGTKLPDWIVVKDMQFTKDNAKENLPNSF
jgi:ribose transport system substrate-binding protein